MLSSVLFIAIITSRISNAYFLSQNKLTWNQARDYCKQTCNSDLVVLYSPTEYPLLVDYINNSTPLNTSIDIIPSVWIGLNDTIPTRSRQWTWIDGRILDYPNYPEVPGAQGGGADYDDCIQMRPAENWIWHEANCGGDVSMPLCQCCNDVCPTAQPTMDPTQTPTSNPTKESESPTITATPTEYPSTSTFDPTPSPTTNLDTIGEVLHVIILIVIPRQSPNVTTEIIDILKEATTTAIHDQNQDCIDQHVVTTDTTASLTTISKSIAVCNEETRDLIVKGQDVIQRTIVSEFPDLERDINITVIIEQDDGQETDAVESDNNDHDDSIWIYIGILAGVNFILMIWLILFIRSRNKKRAQRKKRSMAKNLDREIARANSNSASNIAKLYAGQDFANEQEGGSRARVVRLSGGSNAMEVPGVNMKGKQKGSIIIQGSFDETNGRDIDVRAGYNGIMQQGEHPKNDSMESMYEEHDDLINGRKKTMGSEYVESRRNTDNGMKPKVSKVDMHPMDSMHSMESMYEEYEEPMNNRKETMKSRKGSE